MIGLKETIRARLGTHAKRTGTEPVRLRYEGLTVIHVELGGRIGRPLDTKYWLQEAKPCAFDQGKAKAYLAGEFDPFTVEIRARRPHSLRLLFRAVQAFLQGRYFRSAQLVEKAKSAACNVWDMEAIDLIRGFTIDTLAVDDDRRSGGTFARWRSQADWWTAGGTWPGGGVSQPYWESLALEAVKQVQAQECT